MDTNKNISKNSAQKKFKFSGYKLFIILLGIVLILYAVSLLLPLLWAVMTSFKDHFLDFKFNKLGLPKEWLFSNYKTAMDAFTARIKIYGPDGVSVLRIAEQGFLDMLKNSLLYAIGCSFMATIIPCIVGYAMARFRYRFSDILYYVILFTMALPIVGSLASEVNMAKSLGIYDTFVGIWLMSGTFAGSYTLVFFATFKSIPQDYSEAAEIDGAGEFSIMVRIILPLAINTFAAIMLIKFIAYWNEYESAMIYLNSKPTIAYGLWYLDNNTAAGLNSVPIKLAGCMLLFLPIMILFLIFQDKLMGNVSMGGIKG